MPKCTRALTFEDVSSGHTAQNLKSGDYFGELAFVATCKKFLRDEDDKEAPEEAVRAADVVATSTCRILELSVKNFITILQVCTYVTSGLKTAFSCISGGMMICFCIYIHRLA